MNLVRLLAPHTDADREYQSGDILMTDEVTAKWLADNGLGQRVNENGDALPVAAPAKEKK